MLGYQLLPYDTTNKRVSLPGKFFKDIWEKKQAKKSDILKIRFTGDFPIKTIGGVILRITPQRFALIFHYISN